MTAGAAAPAEAERFPLLPAQMEMFVDATLFPEASTYTLCTAFWFDGPIEPARFARAWNALIAESEALRLRFFVEGATVLQAVMPPWQVTVPFIDLSSEADPQEVLRARMDAVRERAFSITEPNLFDLTLYRLSTDRHMALMEMSHLIRDGSVLAQFGQRLAALYSADDATAPPRPTGLGIAEAERKLAAYRETAAFAGDRAYWQDRLADMPPPLIEAGPRQGVRGRVGREALERFTVADMVPLQLTANQLGVAPFRVMLSLAGLALARVYDRDALMLNVHVHNRDDADLRESEAVLAGQLPFRFTADGTAGLAEVIRQTDAALSRDRAHRRLPPDLLGNLRRTAGDTCDASVNYLPNTSRLNFAGTSAWVDAYAAGFFLPWKIEMRDGEAGGGLLVTIAYDAVLIPQALARAVAQALRALMEDCPLALAAPVSDLRIMQEATRQAVLALAHGQAVALPAPATLPALIAAQTARTPEAVAVEDISESLTYAQLAARVGVLAQVLSGAGVGTGKIVALALPRGVGMVAALLAVQHAGAAFLPIDPEYPAERVAWMLADAQACLVLTTHATAGNLPPEVARLHLDAALDQQRGVPVAPGADDLAYVLYTSGSTGRPKAVMVAQRSISNLALWGAAQFDADALAGMLFSTPLVFDVSMFELFAPLVGGGRLLVVQNLLALPVFPLRAEARVISGVPTILDALLRTDGLPDGVRVVVPAGEALSRDLAERLFAARPGLFLLNAYGPTEATVYASSAQVHPGDAGPVPIGTALANMSLYVLDRNARLLPAGAVGELCLGGAGVADGYLNRPDLTAERFIANPFGHGRLYRTGDRAQWRDDGQVAYLGRADGQVKLHGVRIEVGEVEAALRALPGVAAAAVGLHGEAEARRLVAWIVPDGAAPTPESIRLGLARTLPSAMIPTAYVTLPALPVTVSGKLDRAALPAPSATANLAARRAPSTQMQRALFDLWRDVIDAPAIRDGDFGVDDDLFDLGGDSLSAVLLFGEIEAKFGTRVPNDILAEGVTVARLSEILGQRDRGIGPSRVLPLQPLGTGAGLYCVHGIGGNPLNFYVLSRTMGTGRRFMALQGGWDEQAAGVESVETLASRYVAAIRADQPNGPYLLCGYSFGVTVAFEIAQQISAAGERVADIVMIDAPPSGYRVPRSRLAHAMFYAAINLPAWVREDLLPNGTDRFVANIRRHLGRIGRRLIGRKAPDITRLLDPNRVTPEEFQVRLRRFAAARAYRFKPYPGHITVLRATCQPLMRLRGDASLGWAALAQGGITVRLIPGNHQSLMWNPQAAQLGAVLRDVLDTADPPP